MFKKTKINILLTCTFLELIFILTSINSNLGMTGRIYIYGVPIFSSIMLYGISKLLYGTKRKRTKRKEEINNKIDKIRGELQSIKEKKQVLQEKIDYEMDITKDEIIPVTTVENKKAHVKMRVLRLNQGR